MAFDLPAGANHSFTFTGFQITSSCDRSWWISSQVILNFLLSQVVHLKGVSWMSFRWRDHWARSEARNFPVSPQPAHSAMTRRRYFAASPRVRIALTMEEDMERMVNVVKLAGAPSG